MLVAVSLFVLLPLYLTKLVFGPQTQQNSLAFSAFEGFLRLLFFVGYIVAISLMKDIRRVFQYHGAEHMIIHAFETEGTTEPENAQKYSPLHISCGTSFLVFVLLIMIVLHTFIRGPFLLAFFIRLLLVPVVAAISYEIIRFARKREDSLIVKAISLPGLLVQKLTTREPDLSQLEVAAQSLNELLKAEGMIENTNQAKEEDVND